MAGITLGNVFGMMVVNVTAAPASVAANTSAERVITVPGARVGDFVDATAPGVTAGIGVDQARVTAPDTVAVLFQNSTAGALIPPAGLYQFLVVRPDAGTRSSVSF